ncbi:MAG: 30S ribosomal protein S18 [Candidatus Woykebacteria bacterium RBG_13_40_15]|uniref:Small ribosomal subunit protein bS18 n=1 Tax=Candidatus Woykebacteria bacterium RBG_13_40_15 TaxID=1802593 RepID=A0A1G1W620_9BACT|nr:MAG: 30S ribosomal protein S18 [Candidatus Woykebacteria bacterium RBG_13_40_15]
MVQTKYYVKKVCSFCKEKKEPDYKDVEAIKKFTTERGKILSRARSGVCAAHQKKLATSIKRARNLALLPFVPRI